MANEITADLTSQLPQPRLITFHWQKTLHLRWAEVVAGSDFVSGISCGFFKGEVWSKKILPLLVELFHRNSKLISFFSSLLCNYDNSAFKLLLSTTFATRKTPSWIWRQLWRSNSQTLLFIALTWLTWLTFLTSISNEGLTMVNCLVVNCHNTYKNTKGKGVSFHKLPVNENLKKIWLAKIKREDALPKPENCYVCSDHFIKDDFKRNIQVWKLCFLTFASNWKLCLPFPYSKCIFL